MIQNKYFLLTLSIFLVACTRLLPHQFNYTPMAALALFAGSKFENKYFSILVPLIATFLSDLVLNNVFYKAMFPQFTFFYDGWYMVYLSYGLISLWAYFFLKNDNFRNILGSSLVAVIIFFLVSNLSYFFAGTLYTKNWTGLMQCYIAALPFLKGTFLGTLVWSFILFGTYKLIIKKLFRPAIAQ